MKQPLLSRLRLPLAGALVLAAVAAAADGPSPAAAAGAVIRARFSEESLPAEEMPPAPTPAAAPSATPAATASATSTGAAEAPAPTAQATPGAPAETEPAALAAPEDVPSSGAAPLEVGAVEPELRVSDSSLDAAIRGAASPSMAASLRIVDQARQKVLDNRPDDAIRLLTYALSADPADSYAYFYLGRSWLVKKNYPQAMTFLKRAEIGLSSNPRWLSETLAFEGLTHEESGNAAAAEAAYRLALKAAPGNLMARVGYTRLAAGPAGEATPSPGEASPEAAEPAGAPSASEVTPPPEESPPAAPPPEEFPAAAPTSEEILAPPPAEAPSAN